jgi:putative transcriptional regulator
MLIFSQYPEGSEMISYDPLWTTMEKRGVTKYQLIYHWGISSNTLRRIGHGEAISSHTLNELCLILDCSVQDILQFNASEEELASISRRKEEIEHFRSRKRKK